MILPVRAGPPDWAGIDRGLCECYGLTPPAIDALTLPEILTLNRPARRSRMDEPGMSDEELEEYMRREKAMTPAQRLERMREERHG